MTFLPSSPVVDQFSNGYDHRLPSKRKLEDYASSLGDDDQDDQPPLVPVRMRKDDHHPHLHNPTTSVHHPFSSSSFKPSHIDSRPSSSTARLQFFVRVFSQSKSMVITANTDDTVKSIHNRIYDMTKIPIFEQRLIYQGKQLQWEQSLADCGIQNDAGLQLVGRMRSTEDEK